MRLKIAVTFLTCATVFLTALITTTEQYRGHSAELADAIKAYEDSKFFKIGLKFFKDLHVIIASRYTNVNVLYSPLSMLNILGLMYTGSDGQAHDEIGMALCLPRNVTVTCKYFANLMETRRTPNIEIHMANKLFFNRRLQIRVDFRKNAQQYFDAEVERLTFAKKEPTAKIINQWVARKTNSKITNVVTPESLDDDTKTMVVNAIYFKAKWNTAFSPESTQCHDFTINKFEKVPVDMMFKEDICNYADMSEDLGAKVLEIPFWRSYHESDVTMLIVLPNEIDGLAEVERRLRSRDLRTLPIYMGPKHVDVLLPKIQVESQLDMISILKQLNITSLFDDDYALAKIFGKVESSKISAMNHKAMIKITEGGAEAAENEIMIKPIQIASVTRFNVVEFRADHPFMFAVISPNEVFFEGHIVRPNRSTRKCK